MTLLGCNPNKPQNHRAYGGPANNKRNHFIDQDMAAVQSS